MTAEEKRPTLSDDNPASVVGVPWSGPPCGRLLVGQGTDTWDPLCVLPAGHAGVCKAAFDDQEADG